MEPVPVVDLFSGPGGLAEGFSAFQQPDEGPAYRVALSVEKDVAAHRTLLLRSFLRKFGTNFPDRYYAFLNGLTDGEPNWSRDFPSQWSEALEETKRMQLGNPETSEFLRYRISRLRREHGGRTVLLGGPPCQSYSLVGRSRNAGNYSYNPDRDVRQSLYLEFVDVMSHLRPAIAVMENVKGMLSARHRNEFVFPRVMRKLESGGGSAHYRLFTLQSQASAPTWDQGATPRDFLLQSENHGVPQARHRVFVVCVRRDIANAMSDYTELRLQSRTKMVSVANVLESMPKLRSRLSRADSSASWSAAVRQAIEKVNANRPEMSRDQERRFLDSVAQASQTVNGVGAPFGNARGGTKLPPECPSDLREWLGDPRVERLPNNETKSHMQGDLHRYLFVAAFACAFERSPKPYEFPKCLVPSHANWDSGMFVDRFRVQLPHRPSNTVTSHLAKDGHYFIHPDPGQVRSLTVREAARLQTFPDNYYFHGSRTQQYVQVGNAVPPYLARQIAEVLWPLFKHHSQNTPTTRPVSRPSPAESDCDSTDTALGGLEPR